VRVPHTYGELCTSRVLTMQRLEGLSLSDTQGLRDAQLDLDQTARRGAALFLEMIFTHGFYHADPHPGNFLLLDDNVIGLLDYGMVGEIDEPLREYIEELLMALANRDAAHLTSVVTRISAAPHDLDIAALSLDLTDFLGHYAGQPLNELDLGAAINEMTEIIRRYHLMLPARMGMLLKVLVMLEGTARLVSPRFSLMELVQPYQRKLLLRRLSPTRQIRKLRRMYLELEHLVETLPRGLSDILQQIQSGQFDVHLDHRGLEPSVNRLVLGLLSSSLFVGSAMMLTRGVGPEVYGVPLLGTLGLLMSLLLGLRLIWAVRKSGNLDRKTNKDG
jgi:ubiquinone biosynthesis protein